MIAEGDEVGRREAEELHHYVAGDAHLALMGSAEDVRKALREAMVAAVARNRSRALSLAMNGDDAVHNALEGGVRSAEGGEVPEHSVEDVGAHG